jgi:hypothetical protein
MEAERWQRVRVLREPERLRVWAEDVERLDERIPNVELPVLTLQASRGVAGEIVEFKDVEVRAPAEVVRE